MRVLKVKRERVKSSERKKNNNNVLIRGRIKN